MIGRWKPAPSQEEAKPKGFDDFDIRLGDLMRGERATLGKSLLDVQRELKIKASYIAAIENADIGAFETPGFIAGYVRSYARYLDMDPDESFARFCRESGFQPAHGMSAAASTTTIAAKRAQRSAEPRDPFANPNASFVPRAESAFAQVEPGAVGSVAVLVALLFGLGYGGWWMLQEVQRVQLSPVNEAPAVVAEIDPLGNIEGEPTSLRSAPDAVAQGVETAGDGVSADPLELYRPEALDVPVLTARDGPIAAIDPNEAGALAGQGAAGAEEATLADATPGDEVQVMAEPEGVEVMAVRPSWVRVSAADGTVIFEKILDAGERYAVPPLAQAPLLRAGNSGSVYFVVGGVTLGPASPGSEVVKNVSLDAVELLGLYAEADPQADADLARFVAAADLP